MATINRAAKEISVKVVYYGPGLCGKTTNLQKIYDTANPERRGKLLSVATETDRTLFFDFLPIDLGQIKGMKLKVGLYTVPGQVFYDATRRLVLRGADGVVFVADSQAPMLDSNLESLENLKINLGLNNLDAEAIPLVLQFNKRDLPNALDENRMNEALNWRGVPHLTAVAAQGIGVLETLKEVVKQLISSLNEKVDGASGSVSAAPKPVAAPPPEKVATTPAPVTPAMEPVPSAPAPAPKPTPAPPVKAAPAQEPPGLEPFEIADAGEQPPEIQEAPILGDIMFNPAAAAPAPASALASAPAALVAAPPFAPTPAPARAPAPAPADSTDPAQIRARVQMLGSHLAALESVVFEMKTELAGLKELLK